MTGLEAVYARVVVELVHRRVDRPFDYLVPAGMAAKVRVGSRVLVPFGSRRVSGYVVDLLSQPAVSQTRSLCEVLVSEPAFDREAIHLAGWMSETYLCPFVAALKCMLPAGTWGEGEPAWRWTGGDEAESDDLFRYLQLVDDIVIAMAVKIRAAGRMTDQALRRRFTRRDADIDGALAVLVEHGLVESDIIYAGPSGNRKLPELVVLQAARETAANAVDDLQHRAPRQAAVLSRLLEAGGGLPVDVLRAVAGGRNPLKTLVRKGLVRIEEQGAPSISAQVPAGLEYAAQAPCKQVTSAQAVTGPAGQLPAGQILTEQVVAVQSPAGQASSALVGEVPGGEPPELSPAQAGVLAGVLAAVRAGQTSTVLLHGVTGSGKTEVYLRAIQGLIAEGRQAIVLVPEISLTTQTVGRFCARFGAQVAVLHSGLSVGERYDAWQRIRRGTVSVAVGARSAVFAPFPQLGLIVLDEEHEPSYKQDQSPKYHAREVAQARAAYHGAVVLLASATPSLESYYLAHRGDYRLLSMPARVAARPMPPVEIVDMRRELQSGNRSIFSRALQQGMRDCLRDGRQAILFLNRRGYAGFIVCRDCGNVLKCVHCDVSLTYHQAGHALRCHTCGYQRTVPVNCPVCGSNRIRGFATGTEQVEREVEKSFPAARVIRMDADTTGHKGAHDVILQSFAAGEADVLVGTQMVAKGLDFPRVTLVGVISADITLNLPDFRSRERTFQLLTQVAGRSGRGDEPGRVVIQTYAPENESVLSARDHDYAGFFTTEIENRRRFNYPPFAHLVRVVVSGAREEKVLAAAHTLCQRLQGHYDAGLMTEGSGQEFIAQRYGQEPTAEGDGPEILGPAPALRVKDSFRWLITVKAPELAPLLDLVRRETDRFLNEPQAREVVIGLDVDPLGII